MRKPIVTGERTLLRLPYSEVCMYLRIAGQTMEGELKRSAYGPHMVQLYRDGREYSAPITAAEAGIMEEADGTYTVEV